MYIAHISDLHIDVLDENSILEAKRIVEKINSFSIKPDYVIITGDFVEETNEKNLSKFFEVINQLKPTYFLVDGNREEWKSFNQDIDEYCFFHPKSEISSGVQYVKEFSNHILMVVDNSECAFLSDEKDLEKLAWIEKKLSSNKDNKPIFMSMHKFPILSGVEYFDKYMRNVENKLCAVLEKHQKNIKMIACGHLHNGISTNISGIPVVSTFSSAFSFDFKFEEGEDKRREMNNLFFHVHHYDGEKFISYVVPV